MKKVMGLLLALVVSTPALAGQAVVDVQGAKCTVGTTTDHGDKTTASTCATGARLPSVRFNLGDYSLLADFATTEVGAQYNVCPGFALGLMGGYSESRSDSADDVSDSNGTLFARTNRSFSGGDDLEVTLAGSRHRATDALDRYSASLTAAYFFPSATTNYAAPFVSLEGRHDQSTVTERHTLSGSVAFGVRGKLGK